MTKYFSQNKAISFSQKEFLAAGGEGSVYVKGQTAYKIYTEQSKMIPVGKIQELSVLTHNSIIKPDQIIFDEHNSPAGYTMKYVGDNYVLCQLFTKLFRDKNNITPQITLNLVRRLQEIIDFIHSKHVLVVDLNEMNFLVSKKFDDIFAIDVDSYQTKSFPATAIMENIRDRKIQNNKFTELSDWFSFAILAFNLWILIHPYRGKHPQIKSWQERMDKNVSVFDPKVSLPGICEPFSIIPEAYLNWFKAVFSGKRLPPPKDLQVITSIITTVKKVLGSNIFEIHEILEADSLITNMLFNQTKAYITQSGKSFVEKRPSANIPSNSELIFLPKCGSVIAGYIQNNKLKLINLSTNKDILCDVFASDIMSYDNRFYIKTSTSILEVKFIELGNNIMVSTKLVAQILELASKLYNGTCIQSLLGATYVSFFPKEDTHYQLHIKELNGYKIIDAKYEKKILMVVASKKGKYHKFVIKLNTEHSIYTIRTIEDISSNDINFTILDNGICVHLTDEEKLELFVVSRDSGDIKEIEDPTILSGDIKLFSYGVQTYFIKGNKVYSLKMIK